MGGGEVIRKGWLIKSPPLEVSGIKTWRKRFFKLRSSKVLEYYKSDSGTQKGVINLEDCKTVNSDLFHKKYKYVFDIETHDRVFYLVASSAEEMKSWVDTICKVCGFSHQIPVVNEFTPLSKTLVVPKSTKGDAVISSPVATLPPNVGDMLYNNQFKFDETHTDVYSLASAAIYDVNKPQTDVPAGTRLSEALTAKGLSTQPNPTVLGSSKPLPTCAYFSPHPSVEPPEEECIFSDLSSLYAVPNKDKKSLPRQKSLDNSYSQESIPKHQALTGTLSAAVVSSALPEEPWRPSTTSGYQPAQVMSNGYMRPSEWTNRPRASNSNYDQVPPGPPRPAYISDDSPSSAVPHRSLLLQKGSDQTAAQNPGSTTYINVQELHDEMRRIEQPPQVNRSSKPPNVSSPSANRILMPEQRKIQTQDSLSGSPPNFPTRSNSLTSEVLQERQTSILADIPKTTPRTMQYTQVQFVSEVSSVESGQPNNPANRNPIPLPRGGLGSKAKPRRVNYSEINIGATEALVTSPGDLADIDSSHRLSLGEAEKLALTEKQYVNVARDGYVDDDTDPDYYTHMRNYTENLYYIMQKAPTESQNTTSNDDLYQAPRDFN